MTDGREKPCKALVKAARAVWEAFLAYGPIDDGTEQGTAFDKALDRLMEATVLMEALQAPQGQK